MQSVSLHASLDSVLRVESCRATRRKLPHLLNSNLTIKMPKEADDKRQAAREVIDILQEISDLLVRTFYRRSGAEPNAKRH